MRYAVLGLGLVFVLHTPAEASRASDGVDAVWGWMTSPVNCVAEFSSRLVAVSADFVRCVLNNANPERLVP